MRVFLTVIFVSAILGVCLSANAVKKEQAAKKSSDSSKSFDYSKFLPKSAGDDEKAASVEEPVESAASAEADDDKPAAKAPSKLTPKQEEAIEAVKNPFQKKVEKALKDFKAAKAAEPIEADDDAVAAQPKKAEAKKEDDFDFSKFIPDISAFEKDEKEDAAAVEKDVEPVDADDDSPVLTKFQQQQPAAVESLKNPVQKKVESSLKEKASSKLVEPVVEEPAVEADDDVVLAPKKPKKAAKKDDFDWLQFIPDIAAFEKDEKSDEKSEEKGSVEADDDMAVLQVAPKTTEFHPLAKKIFGSVIAKCSKVKLDCPPTSLFAKAKYLNVACSCEGFRKCDYAKNGTLISNTLGSCKSHHPFNNVKNLCATKANLLQSTHPTLKAPCNMDFSLNGGADSEESSGMPE